MSRKKSANAQVFLKQLMAAGKITDPQLAQEAQALIDDQSNSLFNYGQELLKVASGGRGRLGGGDTLQAATEAAGRMWELLWRPDAYTGAQTWETRFPMSVHRGGIRGTVRAVANNLVSHFAQRLRKSRASVSTFQRSQIDSPIDPEAQATTPEGKWEEWRAAILGELVNDLRSAEARTQGGKHWQARLRNLRWAIEIADKQMEIPYEWRSMPEVMEEIPELRGTRRGGLQQTSRTSSMTPATVWSPRWAVTGSKPWLTRCKHGGVGEWRKGSCLLPALSDSFFWRSGAGPI